MSFSDRIRAFFARRRNPDLARLARWAEGRRGVEGYIEPRTATSPTTLLLVDRDGDHVRGAVGDPEDAAGFCESLGIPVYDASVVGYPRRMRDFERRRGTGGEPDLDETIADLERRLREPGPDIPDH